MPVATVWTGVAPCKKNQKRFMRQESGLANLLDMQNMDISPIQKINIKKSIK